MTLWLALPLILWLAPAVEAPSKPAPTKTDPVIAPAQESPKIFARILGIAQDGGVPHLGCVKECCVAARRDLSGALHVASLALTVERGNEPHQVFIIDATPDLRAQVDMALSPAGYAGRPPGQPVDGFLLTHAHIGHYLGLAYLGRESIGAASIPVYATARMSAFLSGNGPWKRLVDGRHIVLRELSPGIAVTLAPGLTVTPLRVPHREEESDVVGFLVAGPSRRLLYIPDIDDWGRWDQDIASMVASVDYALLDGTFYSPSELGARSMTDVPHPLVPSTMTRLEPLVKQGHRVLFIHMNHTNPVLRSGTPQRAEVQSRGFEVATEGLDLPL